MAQPSYLTTRLVPIGDGQAGDAEGLAARLRQVPGVAVAVVIAEEKLAYLKVDSETLRRGDGGSAGRRELESLGPRLRGDEAVFCCALSAVSRRAWP